jgi:hypothetical protein
MGEKTFDSPDDITQFGVRRSRNDEIIDMDNENAHFLALTLGVDTCIIVQ